MFADTEETIKKEIGYTEQVAASCFTCAHRGHRPLGVYEGGKQIVCALLDGILGTFDVEPNARCRFFKKREG